MLLVPRPKPAGLPRSDCSMLAGSISFPSSLRGCLTAGLTLQPCNLQACWSWQPIYSVIASDTALACTRGFKLLQNMYCQGSVTSSKRSLDVRSKSLDTSDWFAALTNRIVAMSSSGVCPLLHLAQVWWTPAGMQIHMSLRFGPMIVGPDLLKAWTSLHTDSVGLLDSN